ncbi:MAG TPA: hypothetical protein VK148_15475 [Xanthobacteraceae bacterium]|nr:hypothetical protein [Xanthobacteraceae bacterium]
MRKLCNRVGRFLVIGVPFSVSGMYIASTPVEATVSFAVPAQRVSVTAVPDVPVKGTESDSVDSPSELSRSEMPVFTDSESSRKYLVQTAHPGGTMTLQGAELAISRLHPEFVVRLANAISHARRAGLESAGIFSAYRPPGLGVGGFANKYMSLHSYGLAVDVDGIGGPGSATAVVWHRIAAENHVSCPYGAHHRSEWNHCQALSLNAVAANNPLRATVTEGGPKNIDEMFDVGALVIARHDTLSKVPAGLVLSATAAAFTPATLRALSDFPSTRKVAEKPSTRKIDEKVSNSHHEKRSNTGIIPRSLRISSEEQPKKKKYALHTSRTRSPRHS